MRAEQFGRAYLATGTECVELCRRGDRRVGQVARDFDLTETNVRSRVK
jgi:hypothetical protein